MRLVLGAITVVFAGRYFLRRLRGESHDARPAKPQRAVAATGWGTLAGYGSFVAHAGGPPFEIYALPLKLDPKTYTGTSVRFLPASTPSRSFPISHSVSWISAISPIS